MTKPKRYKRYSAEFKREAIRRSNAEGTTDAEVCAELGISTRQFRRWRDELALLGTDAFPGPGRSRDQELTDLACLEGGQFKYIRHVVVAENQLADGAALAPLSTLPHLLTLDASHNSIADPTVAPLEHLQVLRLAHDALERAAIVDGQRALFEALAPELLDPAAARPRAETAAALGMEPVALRVAVHRLKRRYREEVLRVVRETLGPDLDAGEELRALQAALAGEIEVRG